MDAIVIQHVPFEGPGYIAEWLAERGARTRMVCLYEDGAELPDPGAGELAVLMGGPMSVNDESAYGWLREEKEYVRARVEADRPTLGVCLGAQLIANALGSRVYPGPEREVGWFPVCGLNVPEGAFRFPDRLLVLHWHGETFDLPRGAVHLARSAGCENQAFQLGRRVIGLQFHLEATPESLRMLVENARADLAKGGRFVMSEREILEVGTDTIATAQHWMGRVLEYLLS